MLLIVTSAFRRDLFPGRKHLLSFSWNSDGPWNSQHFQQTIKLPSSCPTSKYIRAALQDDLTYKGVVFNEMKGVYSSADSANMRAVQRALFPDMTYSVDSGGDPTVIPELTYDEFKSFHSRYYHPSNARFWFYGDDDPVERLRILDGYLSEFDAKSVDSTVHAQPLFQVCHPQSWSMTIRA